MVSRKTNLNFTFSARVLDINIPKIAKSITPATWMSTDLAKRTQMCRANRGLKQKHNQYCQAWGWNLTQNLRVGPAVGWQLKWFSRGLRKHHAGATTAKLWLGCVMKSVRVCVCVGGWSMQQQALGARSWLWYVVPIDRAPETHLSQKHLLCSALSWLVCL